MVQAPPGYKKPTACMLLCRFGPGLTTTLPFRSFLAVLSDQRSAQTRPKDRIGPLSSGGGPKTVKSRFWPVLGQIMSFTLIFFQLVPRHPEADRPDYDLLLKHLCIVAPSPGSGLWKGVQGSSHSQLDPRRSCPCQERRGIINFLTRSSQHLQAKRSNRGSSEQYRGTSLKRTPPPLGLYRGPMPGV